VSDIAVDASTGRHPRGAAPVPPNNRAGLLTGEPPGTRAFAPV